MTREKIELLQEELLGLQLPTHAVDERLHSIEVLSGS